MQELVERVAAATGLDAGKAAHAIGVILGFLKRRGPQLEGEQLIAALPGADEIIQKQAEPVPGAGIPDEAGLAALAGELAAIGLDFYQMEAAGKALFAMARETAGDEVVGRIVAAFPGLSRLL